MASIEPTKSEISSFCALCVSRCGAVATVEDGRLMSLRADPTHPTGDTLCLKGKVAPELVYHPDRLLFPMKRTRPKGDTDPGWERISWDEALDTIAGRLKSLAEQSGPETVAFNTASPSTSALCDALDWVRRLRYSFGSPNQSISMELCGWGRYLANLYSYGAGLPAGCMPDLDQAGCILYWGYNPTVSRIAHASATVAAQKRGARLIVVDPRNAGLARKADQWLRVLPGTDGALALGLVQVMLQNEWYDREFMRKWSNAPHLVRVDNGQLLRESDVVKNGSTTTFVAWDSHREQLCYYDSKCGVYIDDVENIALFGCYEIDTVDGRVQVRTVFDLTKAHCEKYSTAEVEKITGVAASAVIATAEMLWRCRPVAYMAWSGLEQQSNATQTALAIGLLYALTGNFDAPGGNVQFPAVPSNDVQNAELLSQSQCSKTLGLKEHPLGPSRYGHVSSADLYRAILHKDPYAVRGLVSFGSNLLLAHADGQTGRDALAALDFYVHTDLFLNPSAEFADIVLPVTSPFESEGLKIGFETSERACSHIQLRKRLVEPRGETRRVFLAWRY